MKFQYGDIVGVKAEGISSVFSWMAERIFNPSTELLHFLIIAQPVDDDYVILESIGKGVAIGRLSWYASKRYDVFRIKEPEAWKLGRRACLGASHFGRHQYDYLLCVKLFIGILRCFLSQVIKERCIRRIRPAELPYTRDSAFICTEFANEVWRRVGYPLVPKGVTPLPSSIYEAYLCGKLECIYQNY